MAGRAVLSFGALPALVLSLTWVGCRPSVSPPPTGRDVRCVEQASGTDAGLRGVRAVSPEVAWASGTQGTCLRTVDGGRTWRREPVAGAEQVDFRDVEAFDADTAWLMATNGRIYQTTDGGRNWQLQLGDDDPGVFLDAIAFWDREHGIAFGDPVDGAFLLLVTDDGGGHWRRVEPSRIPPPLPSEAGFAGSGSCLTVLGTSDVWFGTGGGPVARVYRSSDRGQSWHAVQTPLTAGTPSGGIFGLAFRDLRSGVAVGGDYKQPETAVGVAATTGDGGRSWRPVGGPGPGGYRSGVAFAPGIGDDTFVAVGTSGADLSRDGGASWEPISDHALNAVSFAARTPVGWAVGPKGRIIRIEGQERRRSAP